MQVKNVNWIGFGSGIMLIAVILLSLYYPWWQLKIGDFGYVNVSSLKTDFGFLGMSFAIPVLMAVNVSCLLLFSLSATLMIFFSINSTNKYSKELLCCSYKKPLTILIIFVIAIVAFSRLAPILVEQYAQIDVTLPIVGTSLIQVPSELFSEVNGVQISVAISGAFQPTFYFAIVASVMCVIARFFYGKRSSVVTPITDTIDKN